MSKHFMDKVRKAAKGINNSYFGKKDKGKDHQSSQVFQKPKGWLNQMKKKLYKDNERNKEQVKGKQHREEAQEKLNDLKKMATDNWNKFTKPNLQQLKPKFESINLNTAKSKLNQIKQSLQKKEKEKSKKQSLIEKAKETINQITERKQEKSKVNQETQSKKQINSQKWFRNFHFSEFHLAPFKQMIQKQLKTGLSSKFDIMQNIFQKMYWKFTFLLILMVFAYGIGSSIPRQIRKLIQQQKSKTKQPSPQKQSK